MLAWHERLSEALASGSDSRSALVAVCEAIRRLVGCDAVQVWRTDVRQMSMTVLLAVGYPADTEARILGLAVPMHRLPLGDAFLAQRYLGVPDVARLAPPAHESFADVGVRAAAFVLLERGDRVLGALQLSWHATTDPAFPAPEVAALIGRYASIAVDVHAKTDEAIQVASTLSDTAMLLASIHDPEALLEAMARRIADAVGCEWGAVHLAGDDEVLRYAAGWGPADALAWLRETTASGPAVDRRFRAPGVDDAIEVPDARDAEHVRRHPGAARVSSYVAFALRRDRQLIGVLALGHCSRTGRFSRRQMTLARGLAHHAVAALGTARLVRSLEQTSQVKTDFVAAVSHDLRTPLHILLGYAEMLLEDAAGTLTEAQRDIVQKIHDRSSRFLELIGGILEVARLDAGRGALRDDAVLLESLCADLAREVGDLKRTTVALEWATDAGTVRTDEPKVRIILRNLVSNALKFTQQGTVSVRLERTPGNRLRIRVRDTGPGIPREDRATLFSMFTQGDAGRRAGGSGLGLGLYLVKRVAEVMGGDVRLVSGEPGDTVFEVELPLAAPAP